jgi:hypothetical protein
MPSHQRRRGAGRRRWEPSLGCQVGNWKAVSCGCRLTLTAARTHQQSGARGRLASDELGEPQGVVTKFGDFAPTCSVKMGFIPPTGGLLIQPEARVSPGFDSRRAQLLMRRSWCSGNINASHQWFFFPQLSNAFSSTLPAGRAHLCCGRWR